MKGRKACSNGELISEKRSKEEQRCGETALKVDEGGWGAVIKMLMLYGIFTAVA